MTSRLQSFESEAPTQDRNLARLTEFDRKLIAKVQTIDSPRQVVLDMDSTRIPVYGEKEPSYNGHFERTCYHRLPLFQSRRQLPGGETAPHVGIGVVPEGNVHRAEGCEELLLPEFEG